MIAATIEITEEEDITLDNEIREILKQPNKYKNPELDGWEKAIAIFGLLRSTKEKDPSDDGIGVGYNMLLHAQQYSRDTVSNIVHPEKYENPNVVAIQKEITRLEKEPPAALRQKDNRSPEVRRLSELVNKIRAHSLA